MRPYAIGFLVGLVTAALLLLIAFLLESSQIVVPEPYDPTDEAGA